VVVEVVVIADGGDDVLAGRAHMLALRSPSAGEAQTPYCCCWAG
jgi:hypothetical protein